MAQRLLLMRHARPEPPGPGPDLERPLAPEGVLQARDVGRQLRSMPPDWVLSSPAVRCRQTADAVLEGLGSPVEIAIDQALLAEDAGALPSLLSAGGTTLVVSHEPTLATLGARLIGPVPPVALRPGQVVVLEAREDGGFAHAGLISPAG